jgi:hypothetical protein
VALSQEMIEPAHWPSVRAPLVRGWLLGDTGWPWPHLDLSKCSSSQAFSFLVGGLGPSGSCFRHRAMPLILCGLRSQVVRDDALSG